jgi:NhaP-type Na+/H+ or K+/H+ antiporter
MNTLRGLGACAVLAGIAYTVTKVSNLDELVLVITVTIVTVSLITYLLSIKRRRHDRRAARGSNRSRRAAS